MSTQKESFGIMAVEIACRPPLLGRPPLLVSQPYLQDILLDDPETWLGGKVERIRPATAEERARFRKMVGDLWPDVWGVMVS